MKRLISILIILLAMPLGASAQWWLFPGSPQAKEDTAKVQKDSVLKPKETPFAEWAELPKLIAQTGEKGAKINVLFLFAPKATPVSALTPAVSVLGDRIGTFYVFGE